MKKTFTIFLSFFTLIWCASAQINFDQVDVEAWYGNGEHEVMFVVDFDSDPIGTDSTFAWGIRFESDSISGVEVMNIIAQLDNDFIYDISGDFLNNINYTANEQIYTNPNPGWFSILEAPDGENWDWNNGIGDNVGDGQWFGIVVMDPDTWEAEINIPLLPVGFDKNFAETIHVNIYPNPATELLFLEQSEHSEIIMVSMSGQLVYHEYGKNACINLTDVMPGLYVVKIIREKASISKKIIVQ